MGKQDRIFLTYVLTDILFLMTGGLLIIFALKTQSEIQTNNVTNVARNLLLKRCPLTAAIANAVVVFFSFLVSIPVMLLPTTRGWLKLHGYTIVICAVFTLIIGLDIWFETLKTRSNLSTVWNSQSNVTQGLLQQELKCCGYFNSTSPLFVTDSQCPTPAIAAQQVGCVTPFSSYANNFLDLVFTGAFGIVGVDVALILAVAMLLKDRKEKERYRHIDEKNGTGAF